MQSVSANAADLFVPAPSYGGGGYGGGGWGGCGWSCQAPRAGWGGGGWNGGDDWDGGGWGGAMLVLDEAAASVQWVVGFELNRVWGRIDSGPLDGGASVKPLFRASKGMMQTFSLDLMMPATPRG